ncbi:MAG: metallopeptidase family protein [Minisyncoccia bacterium]|jgi:predicted Zn-dependent protease with MMP-like domain
MDWTAFKRLVADVGFSPVPEKFRGLIENAALLVEDDVPEETRRDMGLAKDETLLGLYHGIPRTARGESYGIAGTLPDTITLYRRPILKAAEEDGIPVQRVVEETIWHEVAHHFGLNEDEVVKREKSKRS